MPKVRCALEQSRCSILLGIGSWPEVRDARTIVTHIGDRFHARGFIRFEDVEENVIKTFGEFEFAVRGPKKPFL